MTGGRPVTIAAMPATAAMAALAAIAGLTCAALAPSPALGHWGVSGAPTITTIGDTVSAVWEWSAGSPFAAWQLRDRFDADGDGLLSAGERGQLVEVCLVRAVRDAGLRLDGRPLRELSRGAGEAIGLEGPVRSTAPLAWVIRVRGIVLPAGPP